MQVLEEPQNGSATDLPITPVQPVNTNVPQGPHMNTNVPRGPPVNTNVPKDTKVSPIQEVAAPIVASQTTQQSVKTNTEVTSSLPTKQPNTEASGQTTVAQSQGNDVVQNATQAHNVATQSAQIPTGSPTQHRKPQGTSSPRPASPVVSVAQPTQSVATQDPTNAVQQATSTQTSFVQEQKTEASASTATRDLPQENIRVQSPMSNHPPIYIPIAPSETPSNENNTSSQSTDDPVSEKSRNSLKSQNSTESEKTTKHDDIILQLTSSIQTQTSFDKNTVIREQSKKSTERKTIEKSSSDEQPQSYDDSDGSVSSEKSYSRQSSDSYSAHDVDISSAVHKNMGILQSKVDIEHWLNQVLCNYIFVLLVSLSKRYGAKEGGQPLVII